MRGLVFLGAFAAFGATVPGCDLGTPALSDGGKGPAPRVVWRYPFAYLSPTSDDGNMAVDVPTVTSIRFQFDRFLEPNSAVRGAICIESESPGAPGCVGGALEPEYDPVDRVAVWKNVQLAPNQIYNVRLLAPKDANDPNGIRAFDGVPLEREQVFSFRTGAGPAPTATWSEPNRSGIHFCSTSAYCVAPSKCESSTVYPESRFAGPGQMLEGCVGASAACHAPPTKGKIPGQAAGSALTLKDADGGVPGAVSRLVSQSVVATETAVGPAPDQARRSEKDIFGVNMPFIDAKHPGNSYLLYKVLLSMPPRCVAPDEESANTSVLADSCMEGGVYLHEGFTANQYACSGIQCVPDAAPVLAPDAGPPAAVGQRVPPIVASWVPEARWKPPTSGEYDRLRRRMRGDQMPPPGNLPTTYQQVLAISAWIAAGATTNCP